MNAIMSKVSTPLAIAATVVALYLIQWRNRQRDLPPGPTRLPLIGSLLSLPKQLESGFFNEICKTHKSDIVHFDAMGMNIIVLNSYEATKELLDTRSGIYSSRPHMTMLNELSGFGFEFALWPYGDRWRAARRMFSQYFKPEIYEPRESRYTHRLLQQLLADPSKWYAYIRLLTTSAILDMTYGLHIHSVDDQLVQVADEGVRLVSDLGADGAYLVDLFPILKHLPAWFPGANFQRIAAKLRVAAARIVEDPFKASVDIMKSGTYEPSFLTSYLNDIQHNNGSEDEVLLAKEIAAIVYMAGSDTSTAVLVNFVAAMVMHPKVQRIAQKELDSVLHGRLPDHQDLSNLPYLTAIILESYRLHPVTPLAIAHSNIKEDVYEGYRIPSGSFIIPNAKVILHNEKDFPEPGKFKPERFIKDGEINPEVKNPFDMAFGFGRRICPGRHIAHSSIMLVAASILSVFDIVKCKDAKGSDVEPNVQYHHGIICQPQEFPCDFKPRSHKAVDIISSLAGELL